jgi:hypothetical protein
MLLAQWGANPAYYHTEDGALRRIDTTRHSDFTPNKNASSENAQAEGHGFGIQTSNIFPP